MRAVTPDPNKSASLYQFPTGAADPSWIKAGHSSQPDEAGSILFSAQAWTRLRYPTKLSQR
jgi:hypothetical protein